jgi:hypothetical protein
MIIPTLVGSWDVVPTLVGWYGSAPPEEIVAERVFRAGGRLYIFPGEARVYVFPTEQRTYLYGAEGRGYELEAEARWYELQAEARVYIYAARSGENMPISGFGKYPSESFLITIDFTNRIPSGRTLSQTSSIVRAINQDDGSDDASTILTTYDPPTVVSPNASVTVKAGASGDRYELQFQISLDSGGPIEERVMMEIL